MSPGATSTTSSPACSWCAPASAPARPPSPSPLTWPAGPVHPRAVLAGRGHRGADALARGRPGHHLPDLVPPLPVQRLRPDPHHAVMAAGIRPPPAGDRRDRLVARAVERARAGVG